MQATFVLIDLLSQRHAVRKFLREVDADSRIKWMESWGDVQIIDQRPGFPLTYVFESRFGLSAGFFFDETGDFIFLGDHQTFR